MQLSKPKLFSSLGGFVWTMIFFMGLLSLRLWTSYQDYQAFIQKPFYYTYATVMIAYEKQKGKRRYQVLKLKSDEGFVFYTTTHYKKNLNYHRLRVQIFPDEEMRFIDYLGTFYSTSNIKKQERLAFSTKEKLLDKIFTQHNSSMISSFYEAIFFATRIEKDLRDSIALLGVSHLVALSGFHLGILWGLVYGILNFFYRPFQQKFFPYRYALFDIGIVAMALLGFYVWFVDFPPSLLRSYAMVCIGWIALLVGIELLSFTFLATIIALLLLVFPPLLISISFWFSVAGVFYIYLILYYSKGYNIKIIAFIFIPFGIFILMIPITHSVFSVTSFYQFLSPFLSLIFVPFYPLVMLSHLLGFGSIFDSLLLALFSLPQNKEIIENEDLILVPWMLLIYIVFSIGAIGSKRIFWGLMGLSFGYMVYLFKLYIYIL
jgi:competence protein ComEC